MATPGNTTIHHGGLKASARTPPSMLPQLGIGGGTPTPTKLNAASRKMAAPRCPGGMIKKGATHWGATCGVIRRAPDAPSAPAASTTASPYTATPIDRTT